MGCVRERYRRRRHRAHLDGTNKIRPNFTVQTAKQWYWFYFHIGPGSPRRRGRGDRSDRRIRPRQGERSGRGTDEAAVQRRRRARPEPEGRPGACEGGREHGTWGYISSDECRTIQRARHVVVESLAEVRREKRNRDIVDAGVGGMRKKSRAGRNGWKGG